MTDSDSWGSSSSGSRGPSPSPPPTPQPEFHVLSDGQVASALPLPPPLMPSPPDESLARRYLLERETGAARRRRPRGLERLVPGGLKERPMRLSQLSTFNKIFAASWLNSDVVLMGSKDNQLLAWNLATDRTHEIALPPSPATTIPRPVDMCGIHSVDTNEAETLVATGGDCACDIAVFRLPYIEPLAVLQGHTDWVFATAWLSETVLASGGRDGTVRVWDVAAATGGDGVACLGPTKSLDRVHKAKVRDLSLHAGAGRLASLGVDGCVHVWDTAEMRVARSVHLQIASELVCATCDEDRGVFLCGSHRHIQFVDARSPTVPFSVRPPNCAGIRSLSCRRDVVTIGGGQSQMSFFDLRAGRMLETGSIKIGPGWVRHDGMYSAYFSNQGPIPHAIYAHEYDRTGARLFAAGGPLQHGLVGSYAAVW